jgi:hypothetical protein
MDERSVVADQLEQVLVPIRIFYGQRGKVRENQRRVFPHRNTAEPQCLDKSIIHVTVDGARWMRFGLCEFDIPPDLREERLVPGLGNSYTGKKCATRDILRNLPKDLWYCEGVL